MSIGEALAQARHDAGLSIADVSDRTRIKLSVIDDIEHDNYAACGGDSRTRSTITAIAQAVGVDPNPLIEAYDAARQPGDWIIATSSGAVRPSRPAEALTPTKEVPEPVTARDEPDLMTTYDEPGPVTAQDEPNPVTTYDEPALEKASEDTEPIPMRPVLPEPIPAGPPPESIPIGLPSEPIAMTPPSLPNLVGEPTPTPYEPPGQVTSAWPAVSSWTALSTRAFRPSRPVFTGQRQRPLIWIALGGALLAVSVLGGILLIIGASSQPTGPAIAAGSHHHRSPGPTHPARTPSASPTQPTQPTRSARPISRPRSNPGQALAPASIAAFGPGGTGQGDSPQLADQALADKAAVPWHSAWYTTANFGNLQSGTGLLLDMGRPVTITSARMTLGNLAGADVTLRIGNKPTLASLSTIAHASDAGGVVKLKTTPTIGRYVLVWFTRLPPDQAGTFEVSVYDIKLLGRR